MSWIFKNSNYTKKSIALCSFVLLIFCFNISSFAQEQQLQAPTISVENPIEVNTANFSLSWDALDETNFYYFELCADAACALKIKEIPNAGKPSVTLSDIKNGQFYWRVSGVDSDNKAGKYSTPQPLLVSLLPVLNHEEVAKESSSDTIVERTFLELLINLPWYIHLILLAYLIFIARTLIWYFKK